MRNEDCGELQLTFGATFRRYHQSAADGSSVDLDLGYGLTDRLQLQLELPYGLHSTPTSEIPAKWSTITTGAFYQFIRSSRPFALSVGAGVGVPLNSGESSFEPELLMANALGPVQVHSRLCTGDK